MRGRLSPLWLSVVAFIMVAASSVGNCTNSTEALDKILAKYESDSAPGVEIVVVQNGKELYRRAAGLANVEYAIPITKDSVFHIASVSKHFTAFAACLLEQEGKLSLEDDVRKYLPELPSYSTKITLRNLATHTSGLRDFYDLSSLVGFTEADVSYQNQVLKLLFQQRHLTFQPGTKFEYGNSSFTLLGEVVSRVAKMPLSQFLKERVFEPLGMSKTQLVDDPEIIISNRAYSYYAPGGVLYKRLLGPVNVGSTGINSTADDLVRWSQNFENPKVGNSKIIQRMSERARLKDGTTLPYALGQEFKTYRGLTIAFHGGGDAGYRSYLIRVPDRNLTIVILSNSREFYPHDLAYAALDAFACGGPEIQKPGVAQFQTDLTPFEGDYELFPGTIVHLKSKQGKLYLQNFGDSQQIELPRLSKNEFAYPILPYSRFVFDHDRGFKWQLFDMTYPATRLSLRRFKPTLTSLKELVGTYYSTELRDEYTIQLVKGQLVASHRRNEDITLTPFQRDWLIGSADFFGKVIVLRDKKRRVSGLSVSAQRARNIRFDRVSARQ